MTAGGYEVISGSAGLSVHNSDNTQTANINSKAIINYDPNAGDYLNKEVGALLTIFKSIGDDANVGFSACGLAFDKNWTKVAAITASANFTKSINLMTGFNPGIPTGNEAGGAKTVNVGSNLLQETEIRPLQGFNAKK